MSAWPVRLQNSASLKVKQYSPLRVCGMKWRAAFAGERIGGGGERRRELAGGHGGQAALAVEPAEEIRGEAVPFLELHSRQPETRLR